MRLQKEQQTDEGCLRSRHLTGLQAHPGSRISDEGQHSNRRAKRAAKARSTANQGTEAASSHLAETAFFTVPSRGFSQTVQGVNSLLEKRLCGSLTGVAAPFLGTVLPAKKARRRPFGGQRVISRSGSAAGST